MRNAIAFALLAGASACSHREQPVPTLARDPQTAAGPAAAETRPVAGPVASADDGMRVEYRAQSDGRTLLEVIEPQGADVIAYDGGTQVAHDRAPMSFEAQGDKYYRLEVRLASGAVMEKKLAARAGMVGSLRVVVAGDAGPPPMSRSAFKDLVNSIDREAGDVAKLALLKTAAAYNWFTTAMAGVLLEHIVYRESKLDAVPLLKDRILDRQNSYRLIEHFTYREDKAKVQELLLR